MTTKTFLKLPSRSISFQHIWLSALTSRHLNNPIPFSWSLITRYIDYVGSVDCPQNFIFSSEIIYKADSDIVRGGQSPGVQQMSVLTGDERTSHSNLPGLHDHHFLSPLAPAQIRQIDLGDISSLHCEAKRSCLQTGDQFFSIQSHSVGYEGIRRADVILDIIVQNMPSLFST